MNPCYSTSRRPRKWLVRRWLWSAMRTILIPRTPTLCWLGPGESREERPPSRTVAQGPRRPEQALCPLVRRCQVPPTPRMARGPLREGRTYRPLTPRLILCRLDPGESREERPPSRTVAQGPRRPELALRPLVRRCQAPPTPRMATGPLREGRACRLLTPRSSAQKPSAPRAASRSMTRTTLAPRIPTLCRLDPGESREERPPSRTVAQGPRRPELALRALVRRC